MRWQRMQDMDEVQELIGQDMLVKQSVITILLMESTAVNLAGLGICVDPSISEAAMQDALQ